MDNAVYDPKERFLNASLNFAKYHLCRERGEMLLIYSDLAANLGLQEPNKIALLADKFGMNAEIVDQTSMPVPKNKHDPLKLIKKESNIQLWRIHK